MKRIAFFCIRAAVKQVLGDPSYAEAARRCCDDLRSCCGTSGAAEFIENAPHKSDAPDPLKALNRMNVKFTIPFRIISIAFLIAGPFAGLKYIWIPGAVMGILASPFGNLISRFNYRRFAKRLHTQSAS